MPDKFLTTDEIKSYFSPAVYKRGEVYFSKGRVKDVKYDEENQSWTAKVEGSELYVVSVNFNKNGLGTFCECQAYEKYGECKHEAAALLQISSLENNGSHSIQQTIDFEKTHEFIDLFTNFHQGKTETEQKAAKKPLMVQFICKVQSQGYRNTTHFLTIEMKAGLERLYVVRNIKDFIKKVKDRKEHEFTKKFTYDPEDHYFTNDDMQVLSLLEVICQNEDLYKDSYSSYWSRYTTNEKELIIPPIISEDLFKKLQPCNMLFEYYQETYSKIEFKEGQLPISFDIRLQEDGIYDLDLGQLENLLYLDLYGWVFLNGAFYRPEPEKKQLFKDLQAFQEKSYTPELRISRQQIGGFLSSVLPSLKSIARVDLDERMADLIQQPSLHTQIYLEEKDSRVYVKIEYHYDTFVFSPFETEEIVPNNLILIRDSEKEREIMSIIEHSTLKTNGKQLYLEDDPDSIYEFVFYILPELQKKAEVLINGEVQSYLQTNAYSPKTTIDLSSKGNFLEINFDIKGIDQNEVQEVLRSLVEKKRYYRLTDGQFLSLENEEFQNIQQLMEELNIRKSHSAQSSLQVPLYRGLQLDDILKSENTRTVKQGRGFRTFIEQLKNPEDTEYEIPGQLNADLRDYQKVGFQWFKSLSQYQLGGILADDMGLGKTIQSISFILSELSQQKQPVPFLVLSPASLVYNWKSEFAKFAPSIQTEVITGTPAERKALLENSDKIQVFITSYPTLRQDIEEYGKFLFDTVILDEAQAIKNPITKTASAVREVHSLRKFALSGTPIENSLDELWSLFQAVLPGFFPGLQEFKRLPQERISRMVRPFILRRMKKDVLKELPDKIETNHYSELTRQQKELYLGYLERIQKETLQSIESGGFQKNRIKILAGLTRLRQLCCHPSLFLENYNGQSGKLEELSEIANTALESGKRLLIFSQFSSMLRIIEARMNQEGIKSFYLDGKTPAKDRLEMAERFNQGEKDIFLISLKAGGTGLNLTGGDTVILYDLWWNPAVEEQAAGRAHRIGQKKVVQVIRLISRGTIEEKIYDLQQKKKELIEKVIQPGETMLSSLSEDEIRSLLSLS